MLKYEAKQSNFIKIALRRGPSPVNLYVFSEYLFLRIPLKGCSRTLEFLVFL